MPTILNQTTRTTFKQHDNGCYEVEYHEASPHASDEFWGYVDEFCTTYDTDDCMRLLIDLRKSGSQPLRYFMDRSREIRRKHPDTKRPRGRFAPLYSNNLLIPTVNVLLQVMRPRRLDIKLFSDDYDEAMAWLLDDIRKNEPSPSSVRR